jgi:tetratricopeptide (TPR) repeat protein
MPDEQRDFFISFNSADEAYGKAISDGLRAEGFTTFFHPDDLEPGGYIPKWMNDALQNSHQMLALCSPEYMAEGAVYSEAERYAWFWRDTRGEKFRLVPVVLKEVEFPLLFAGYKRLIATNRTASEAAGAVVAALKKPEEIKERQSLRGEQPNASVRQPTYVHTTLLPETGYKRLVGRDTEVERLDKAWLDVKVNIISLIAEGGAGKSALVNEWLKRMQAHNYPGAATVLGWSFFSQGSTERATSAEAFLNWALEKLNIKLTATGASVKADAIAEAMMRHRVLLLLDGAEPLQHGPGPQLGELKDLGLRALLRRFAATPPGAAHGLIVLTSRLEIKDIASWQDGAAPVIDVYKLSDKAGAALLRDNGVVGPDTELNVAARDFGGHPLALGLLASFLKETQAGDVRRRDHIRSLMSDTANAGHDHARRVMESYEKEWLAGRPVLLAMMHIVGLFDRPASGDCLDALRGEPVIEGLTDQIVKLRDGEWKRTIARLREVHLLAPPDPAAPDALDAHPLVREWFGEQLKQVNEAAWKAANGRLYEHLRDTTGEGERPTLEELAPLYQAIAHGCRADRADEALSLYIRRICRVKPSGDFEYYSFRRLGSFASDLAAFTSFFEVPFQSVNPRIPAKQQDWILNITGSALVSLGRLVDALPALRATKLSTESSLAFSNASIAAANLSETELLVGEIASAISTAKVAIDYANKSQGAYELIVSLSTCADALHHAGRLEEAMELFATAQQVEGELYSVAGYRYGSVLLTKGEYSAAREFAPQIATKQDGLSPLGLALEHLLMGRAVLALTLKRARQSNTATDLQTIRSCLEQSTIGLQKADQRDDIPRAYLADAVFRRSRADWDGAARSLDEVAEIADPGPMRLHLCDRALERARLAFARCEAFAPFNGILETDPPRPELPSADKITKLKQHAEEQLRIAGDYIDKCGYHRRDEELLELQAVLLGEKKFAGLPPRV